MMLAVMIELTREQQQALDASGQTPARIMDQATGGSQVCCAQTISNGFGDRWGTSRTHRAERTRGRVRNMLYYQRSGTGQSVWRLKRHRNLRFARWWRAQT